MTDEEIGAKVREAGMIQVAVTLVSFVVSFVFAVGIPWFVDVFNSWMGVG
jgi:hypothetical protein